MRHFLILLMLGWMPQGAFAASQLAFSDQSQSLGLSDLAGPTHVSSWLDIDLDGVAEPVWFSQQKVVFLDHENGETSLKEVTFAGDHPGLSSTEEIQMVIAAGDFTRTGQLDLLVMSSRVARYRVTAPGELTFLSLSDPPLATGVRPFDAAVGDVNGDNWPDIVVAMGRISTEHVYERGERDIVLMNRGGEFELVRIEPSRIGQSNGITLADVNDDRRLDVIESIDFSGATGPARILINETPAGAPEPVFKVAEHTYDVASYGMGAAVEDIDQDGFVDIYNASTGQDFMMFQQPDGTYDDRTWSGGITHEWGTDGGRIQWAPTLTDLDADGDIDVFVRHGHLTNMLLVNFGYVPIAQQHVAYTQDESGKFVRRPVPFDTDAGHGGVDAVFGDLEGDGLPDLTMGTQYLISATPPGEGLPIFWHNDTPLPEGHMAFDVVLVPTVSTSPPTGAKVVGTCGETVRTRQLTSGGRMGATNPSSVHIAWPDCKDGASFEVHWPSGVVSTHEPPEKTGRISLVEPEWMTLSEDRKTVSLKPDVLGGQPLCHGTSIDGPYTCCDTSPCEANRPAVIGERLYVRVGEEGLIHALAPGQGWLTMRTFPSLPAPGSEFTLRVTQRDAVVDEEPWIRIDGAKIPWGAEDLATGNFAATVTAPPAGVGMDTTLFVSSKTQAETLIESGVIIGNSPEDHTLYPYENPNGQLGWRVLFAPGNGDLFGSDVSLDSITVKDQTGALVPSKVSVILLGRVEVQIPWQYVKPGAKLTVYDGNYAFLGPLATYPYVDLDDLKPRVSSARGFVTRTYPVDGGDRIRAFFTLLDQEGHPLPPDPALCVVEIEGATPIQAVEVLPGGWDMSVVSYTDAGLGPGKITVRDVNGEELLVIPFVRRPKANRPVDLAQSSVSLSEETLPAGVGSSAELQIFPRNAFNELLGMDSNVRLEGGDALHITEPSLSSMGFFSSTISPSYYGGNYPVEIWVQDLLLETVNIEVVGPEAPEASHEVNWPAGSDVVEAGASPQDAGPSAPEAEAGCNATASQHSRGGLSPLSLLVLGVLLTLYAWRRRIRRQTSQPAKKRT